MHAGATAGSDASDSRPPPALPRATPPAPGVDPAPVHPRGPINAAGEFCWQNGRATEKVREAWAAGARGAAAKRCPDCTAPLVWNRSIGGELVCWGCTHSALPLRWRRRVVVLWLTGITASMIAERIGSTKSAVLSYRRRALLPVRGSPLVGCDDSQKNRRRRRAIENPPYIRPQTLPAAAPPPRPARRVAKVQGFPTCKPAPSGGAASAAENAGRPKGMIPRHAPRRGFSSCQYVIGRALFCDQPVATLSPYCDAHTQLCFVGKAA